MVLNIKQRETIAAVMLGRDISIEEIEKRIGDTGHLLPSAFRSKLMATPDFRSHMPDVYHALVVRARDKTDRSLQAHDLSKLRDGMAAIRAEQRRLADESAKVAEAIDAYLGLACALQQRIGCAERRIASITTILSTVGAA